MQNEILKPVLETDDLAVPRYDVVTPNGSVAFENVELRLKNEIVQEGTPYSEEAMMPPELYDKLELDKTATPGRAFLEMLNRSGGAVRRNRPPTSSDAESVGKLWVVPKMTFNNLMPNALSQVASNWTTSTANLSVSGNTVTATGNASANSIVMTANMSKSVRAGDKIYVQALVKANNDANNIVADLMMGDTVLATNTLATPASGDTLTLSAIAQPESTGTLKLRISATYNTAAVQSGKGFTLSNVTVWNMTEDMCEAQADNEFTVTEAANYLSTFGQFQTREYEYSTYWWVLRGVTNNQYLWHRIDDYATQAEAEAGTLIDRAMSPLRTKQFYAAQGASDAEVKSGTNTTKWTNPKQVAEAATTMRDDATGNLFTVNLDVSYYDMITKVINLPSQTQYDRFNPTLAIYYNNKIYFIGQRQYSASSNTTYTYHLAMAVVDAVTFEVLSYTKNFYEKSSYSASPVAYMGCVSATGGAIGVYPESSAMALIDLDNYKAHWNISTSYFNGLFMTANYVGYLYVSKVNNCVMYYKSRSSTTTSYTSKSLGLSIYNSTSYITVCGVSGDIVYFVYQDSATTCSLGSFNVADGTVSTGIAKSAAYSNLYVSLQYPVYLTNGKVIYACSTSSGSNFLVVDCVNKTITIKPVSGVYNTDELGFGHYFGTYNNKLYYVSRNSSASNSYSIVEVNRDTFEVISVTPLYTTSFGQIGNDANKGGAGMRERIFSTPFLVNGQNLLNLRFGTLSIAHSKPYVSSSQLYVSMFNVNTSYYFLQMGNIPETGPYGVNSYSSNSNNQPTVTGAFGAPVYSIRDCNVK